MVRAILKLNRIASPIAYSYQLCSLGTGPLDPLRRLLGPFAVAPADRNTCARLGEDQTEPAAAACGPATGQVERRPAVNRRSRT
jgi:hypothetical protein